MTPLEPLPSAWTIAPIGDVADINPKLSKLSIPDELQVSFIPMSAVEACGGFVDVSQSRPFASVRKGYTPFRQGDVLFAKITPCMENGKMAVVPELTNDIGFGSTEFHVLRPRSIISAKYLYYFVSSEKFRHDAEHNMTGAVGQRRVPTAYVSRCLIPLPPLAEQHRIVAKIEELYSELDKGIENLAVARGQLEVYRQSILKYAFDGRMTEGWRETNPHKWVSMSIKDASDRIVDCLHSTPKFAASGKFCIDSTWIENNRVLFDEARFVDESVFANRIVRLKPAKGDVLFVREGSKKIGTAVVANFDDDYCLGQRMMMFRLRSEILPQYFVYYIQSDSFKKQYKPLIGGSASPHLNITDIKRMTFPLCSLNEQREIVRMIDAQYSVIDDLETTIDEEMQRSHALRQAVLKRAFSGRLVAQEANDVTASVRLASTAQPKKAVGNVRKKKSNRNMEAA